jgi:hypothetical protein
MRTPTSKALTVVTLAVGIMSGAVSYAAPSAATVCPPKEFSSPNLAINSRFEYCTTAKTWRNGDQLPASAAAKSWYMHSDNNGAKVTSECVPYAPAPGGKYMLHFIAGGGEGGIYQNLENAPAKVMLSAWVFVKRGQVSMQAQAGNTGPAAWSTKIGEWEQLRVCSDGTVPTGMWAIYNSDTRGGEFYVDRVEVRQIP